MTKAVYSQDLISDSDSDGDLKLRRTIKLGNPFISYASQVIPEKRKSAIFLEKSKHNNTQIPVKPSTIILLSSQVVKEGKHLRWTPPSKTPSSSRKHTETVTDSFPTYLCYLCQTYFKGKFYFSRNQSFTSSSTNA